MRMNTEKINERLNLIDDDININEDNINTEEIEEHEVNELEEIVQNNQLICNPETLATEKVENYPVILHKNSSDAIGQIFQKETDEYEKVHRETTKKFNDILDSSKKILDIAAYILNTSANGSDTENDANLLTSASNLINSIKDIVKESNQSVLQQQEFLEKAKIEHLRAKLKKEIAITTKTPPNLGTNNTFNINNTPNDMEFDQTELIRQIVKAESNQL